jgi:hypothetical protein
MRSAVSIFSATSFVWFLLVGGLGLVAWGLSAQFGVPTAAMVTGLILLWAGARASKGLR